MLPKIKNRLKTYDVYQNDFKRQKSILIKPRINKYSAAKATIPYLQEISYPSIKSSIEKLKKKNKQKRLNTQSLIVDKTQFQSQQVPQQIKTESKVQSFTTPLRVYKRNKIKRGESAKVQNILHFFRMKTEDQQLLIRKSIKKQNVTLRYDEAEQQYFNLPKNKQKWKNQTIEGFRQALIKINPFFKKINDISTLCLLKIGHVVCYQQEEIVQRKNDPIGYFGIVLWGQVLLKCNNNQLKIYLFPGDSLNQQILFNKKDTNNWETIRLQKGTYPIKESGKTKTKTGILYLKLNEYKTIFQELVKIGQRNNILIAENMMKWSYSKKKGLRKQLAHI